MPYKGWESLQIDEECVKRWASRLSASTARNYAYYLLKYLKWAAESGLWRSAEAMLKEYQLLELEDRFRHAEILKRYIESRRTGSRDRRNNWFAVKNFYEYHRLPFVGLSRGEMSGLFKRSEEEKRRAVELSPLNLEDVRQLVMNAPQPYKAAFMVLFQSAMGLEDFTQFNRASWNSIVQELDRPGPLRVDLCKREKRREEVRAHYTFLGEDAKTMIKDWLGIAPNVGPGALFLVYNKNKRMWAALTGNLVGDMMVRVGRKAGLVKRSELGRYCIRPHGFRGLFKSLCTIRGVTPAASEFFLGHKIGKLGYGRSPQYDEELLRREYSKVEPELNILSNPSGANIKARMDEMRMGVALEAVRRLAESFGIDPMRVRMRKREELGREPNSEEEMKAIQNEIRKLREGRQAKGAQAIVAEEQLEARLKDGWQFVTVLPSRRILVSR